MKLLVIKVLIQNVNIQAFPKTFVIFCFCFYILPWWLSGKNPPANAGDAGFIPGLGRSPWGGNGNPLQYSCLGNPMDRGAWGVIVHGSTKSWTRLSDWLTYTERIWRDSTVVSIYILLMTKEVIYCLVLYLPLTSLFVNRSFAYLKN